MALFRLRLPYLLLQRYAKQLSAQFRPLGIPVSSHLDQIVAPDHIQVTPDPSLFDQEVSIRVQGLTAKAKVTLQAKTQQVWKRRPAIYTSCGHYITGEKGDLDLSQDSSSGGTYTGVDPMGLFWSMRPCPSGPQDIRMVVENGDVPVSYTLSLYQGHWSLSDLVAKETTLTPLSSTTVTRLKKTPDVRRIPVKEGGVRGMLFLPPGEGPHPGVIDMFGTAGGLMEIRAALLASHGFAVLALPFFRFDDLPEAMKDVPFDYFEEAVSWLSAHRAVKDGGIGVVGSSKGGEYALMMAWKCPQVTTVVTINTGCAFTLYDVRRKDGTLLWKGMEIDMSKCKMTENALNMTTIVPNSDDYIPVWESSAHVLMLVSGDDGIVNPQLADTHHSLYPAEKRHLLEVVRYPGAGHLVEPPYTPHCRACFSPLFGVDILWGGNPADHAAAQRASWSKMLTFLLTHLS